MKILGLTIRNWAELDEPGSPELAGVVLPVPPNEALSHIQKVVETLPRWRVEMIDQEKGTIHLTRRTRLLRFVDDIHLRLEAQGTGSRIHGKSQSRVGLSDLGQNRRNLVELVKALRVSGSGAGE